MLIVLMIHPTKERIEPSWQPFLVSLMVVVMIMVMFVIMVSMGCGIFMQRSNLFLELIYEFGFFDLR